MSLVLTVAALALALSAPAMGAGLIWVGLGAPGGANLRTIEWNGSGNDGTNNVQRAALGPADAPSKARVSPVDGSVKVGNAGQRFMTGCNADGTGCVKIGNKLSWAATRPLSVGFLDNGNFLFPDNTGKVHILNSSGQDIGDFATGLNDPTVIKEHPNGKIYVLDQGAGELKRYK